MQILALIPLSHLAAQEISFDHITTDGGLVTGNVRTILEDYQGFIWFGTEDGLQRYDGHSMVNYHHDEDDSTTISSNYILYLFEDSKKNLWIGTLDAGLCLYDRSKDSFRRFIHNPADNNSILGNYVRIIYETADSTLYLGLEEGGFSHFKTPSKIPSSIEFTNFKIPKRKDRSGTNLVGSIVEDTDHSLLIGVNGAGLNRFNPKTKKFEQLLKDSCSNSIHHIFLDSKNRMWIGSWDNGLFIYDRNSKKLIHHTSEARKGFLPHNQIENISEDSEGNFWIGTDNGLSVIRNGTDPFSLAPFTTFKHNPFESNSLLSNSIKVFFIDKRNRFWIGSYYGGINVYDKNALKFFPIKSKAWLTGTLTHNNVFTFAEDGYGDLWVGTDGGGLHHLKKPSQGVKESNFTKVPIELNHALADKIKCLETDGLGNLWIGTWGTGMFKLNINTKSYEHFGHDANSTNGLLANEVTIIKADSLNNLWIGTFNGGLHYFDPKQNKFTHYSRFPSKSNSAQINRITSIHIGRDGKVWVAREVGGLNLFDSETQLFKTIEQGILTKLLTILSIHEDKEGVLWLGTNGAGLIRYNPKKNTVKVYNEKSGLSNNVVYAILEDTLSNTAWFSTNKGLSVLDLSKETFVNYSKADGLQGNQFNHGSALLYSNGTMVFGGTDGMNAFIPGDIKKSNYLSPLVFTRFSLQNKEVSIRDPQSPLSENIILTPVINLNHDQNSFDVEFTMLEYNLSNRNEYAYFLEELNTRWQEIGRERKATFTNLNPGTYKLKIKASNSDGFWTNDEKSITIVVHPAWYQTILFKIIVIACIGLFIFAMVRIRLNFLLKQKAKLERQVLERTTELKHKNNELSERYTEIQNQNTELQIQKMEIASMNHEIQAQNEELTSQNDHINLQREDLEEARTNLKQINDQLELLVDQRTQKLEETIAELDKTIAELDRFVYSASHDLSAPLKSILGLVNIARIEQNPETVKGYLDYIETSIRKLDKVIKSLVEFSRNSKQEVNIAECNIHQLTQDVLNELAFWPDAQKINFINKIEVDKLILTDQDRLKVILHNLIGNGVKYADLSKENSFVQIETHSTNSHVILTVSDNGIGIEEKYQPKIFDMYYRGTDRSKGSGLGLFIVKEIMIKLGGNIDVSSSKGKGSTFTLTLKQS